MKTVQIILIMLAVLVVWEITQGLHSCANADERPIVWTCEQDCSMTVDELRRLQWLNRYTVHQRHCRLVDNPDDGLVSGPTPQVCAPPETPRYPPGAGRGLLDPQRPERSFAR